MTVTEENDELWADPALRPFVDGVRGLASGPSPVLGPELAAVLASGTGAGMAPDLTELRPSLGEGGHRRLRHRLQGRRARLALGGSVISLGLLGGGAAGALPTPVQAAFDRSAEVLGVELPEEAGRGEEPSAEPGPVASETQVEPAPPVERDATGPLDGELSPPPSGDGRASGTPGAPATARKPGDRPQSGAAPGGDVAREARDGLPGRGSRPVSPLHPQRPQAAPGGPPDRVPARYLGEGEPGEEGRDDASEPGHGAGEEGHGSTAPAAPPAWGQRLSR